jgi:catechol 2,3-dioxygenase-like lactoylglutathione lyase family enzyme
LNKVFDVKFVHTNLVARDWKRLAEFYIDAFGCKPKPPERNLKGEWLDKATSQMRAHIEGIHLMLPGYGNGGPTLEVFQYTREKKTGTPSVNRPGFGHIAFAVKNVAKTLNRVERYGGGRVGEVVSTKIEGVGHINFVYARDPEGNIIELQKWG